MRGDLNRRRGPKISRRRGASFAELGGHTPQLRGGGPGLRFLSLSPSSFSTWPMDDSSPRREPGPALKLAEVTPKASKSEPPTLTTDARPLNAHYRPRPRRATLPETHAWVPRSDMVAAMTISLVCRASSAMTLRKVKDDDGSATAVTGTPRDAVIA